VAPLGHSAHERRVALLAVKLFDLLRARHKLDSAHRQLLWTASLVHDAAKESSPADHDVRGAELVLRDRSLRLSPARRRAVAFLVRYHRDADGAIEAAADVDGIKPDALMTLLALLHAADGLDSRRVSVEAVIARRKGRTLHITCVVARKLARARRVLARARKFKLLDRTLGVAVSVRVERAIDEATASLPR
jgi:exopolyphosphatase/pppGpp-phosphohydrolase